jgi:RNA polymerase sigma factor (sigma-70 family)
MTANAPRQTESQTGTCDDCLPAFLSMRPRLFRIAYRMLGSAAEAEDVVQDVWLRWQAADRSEVRNAAAFLSTTAARLAINVMQSARARHETLAGPWPLEPVAQSGDPRVAVERCQALACGVRLLLEKLTPTERAAYILREAFGYAYRDIAKVLRLAEANARQIVTRARHHLASGRTLATSSIEQKRLLAAFIAAAQEGDVAGLERLFASNVFSTSGAVRAA